MSPEDFFNQQQEPVEQEPIEELEPIAKSSVQEITFLQEEEVDQEQEQEPKSTPTPESTTGQPQKKPFNRRKFKKNYKQNKQNGPS